MSVRYGTIVNMIIRFCVTSLLSVTLSQAFRDGQSWRRTTRRRVVPTRTHTHSRHALLTNAYTTHTRMHTYADTHAYMAYTHTQSHDIHSHMRTRRRHRLCFLGRGGGGRYRAQRHTDTDRNTTTHTYTHTFRHAHADPHTQTNAKNTRTHVDGGLSSRVRPVGGATVNRMSVDKHTHTHTHSAHTQRTHTTHPQVQGQPFVTVSDHFAVEVTITCRP